MADIGSELGGYRLERLLGEGGFGAVFLGEHRGDGHRAAVKVLHRRHLRDTDFKERFAREVDLIRKVRPFCTAPVLAADPHGDPPWIATEYVDGPSLEAFVRQRGPGADGDLYRIAVSTMTALVAVHGAGVVHRDFKPDNILLGRNGIRVIDFGVSRALEGSGAGASAILGTPRYMAPEQFDGDRPVTTAIDMFAWALVMVYAATGRSAFEAPNMPAFLMRLTTGEPDLDGVPEALLPLVRRCLDREPRNRPQADEALMALLGRDEAPDEARTVRMSPEEIAAVLGTGREQGPGSGDTTTIRVSADEILGAVAVFREEERPFRFGGADHTSQVSLAGAFQGRWADAAALLRSPERRRELARWPALGAAARNLLTQAPPASGEGADEDLLLARLVARMAPGLPPRHRGEDLSWHLLVDGDGNPAPFLGGPAFAPALGSGLLRILGRHHCRTPGEHGCDRGAPCVLYGRTAENLRLLVEAADAQRAWSDPLADVFTDGRLRFSPPLPRLVALAHRAAAHPDTDPGRLAVLAEEGLDPDDTALRSAVREAVLRAAPGEGWALAVILREAAPQLDRASRAVRGLRALVAHREGLHGEGGRVEGAREEGPPGEGAQEPVRDDTVFFYAGMSVLLFVFAGVGLLLGQGGAAAVLGAIAAGTAVVGAATTPGRLRRLRRERDRERAAQPQGPPPVEGLSPVDGDAYTAHLRTLERALGSLGAAGRSGADTGDRSRAG